MRRRLAVLGASGQIGVFLLPQLVAAGHDVLALSRRPVPAGPSASTVDEARLRWLPADLHGLMPALDDRDCLLCLGPLDALVAWLDTVQPAALRRVIAFSSMSAESKREAADPAERELAARLRRSEDALLELGRARDYAVTIFRPTLIYGAGLDRSLTPLAALARRWRVMPIPLAGTGLRQPVHAADLAGACLAALDCPASHGRIYPLGGGERLSFRAVCRRLGAGLGKTVLPLPLPAILLRMLAHLPLLRGSAATGLVSPGALARLGHDLIADNSAAASDFGYNPRPFIPAATGWGPPPR